MTSPTRSARRRLLALALGVCGLFGAAAGFLPHSPDGLRELAAGFGGAAPLIWVGVWILLTPALFSGTLLAAAGGLLFGPVVGVAVSLAGATLGGAAAFLLARGFGAGAAERLAGPRVRRVQERLERRGFASVAALRLAPGVPATLLHYAAGLSRIRLRDFAGGLLVGGAPRVIAYTALGGALADPSSPVAVALAAGLVLLGLPAAAVAWRRRAALRAAAAA